MARAAQSPREGTKQHRLPRTDARNTQSTARDVCDFSEKPKEPQNGSNQGVRSCRTRSRMSSRVRRSVAISLDEDLRRGGPLL